MQFDDPPGDSTRPLPRAPAPRYSYPPPVEPPRSSRGWMVAFFTLLALVAAAALVWLLVLRSDGGGVEVSASAIDFGDQDLGKRSAAQVLTVDNGGSSSVAIAAVAVEGPNAKDFQVAGETSCAAGEPLGGGDSCTIGVSFRPRERGERSARLVVTLGGGREPLAVDLRGTGTGEAAVVLETTRLDLGTVLISKSRTRTFQLTNAGSAPLRIEALALQGGDRADFRLARKTDCPTGDELPAGASCTIAVAFTPAAAGKRGATLVIAHDAPGSPSEVELRGEGRAQAKAELGRASLDFGDVEVGATGKPLEVSLSNTGTAELTVGGIAFRGSDVADFALAKGGTCAAGTALAPGEACTIRLAFSPSGEGPRRATLEVSAAGRVHETELSGTGVVAAATTAPAATA